MNIVEKVTSRKKNVEQGEELLHQEYGFRQAKGKELTIVAGVDGGSTQTRTAIVDVDNLHNFEEELTSVYVIPSVSATIPDDRPIVTKSNELYDVMDSVIVNLDASQNSMFKSVRLVRGTKQFDVQLRENRLSTSTQKSWDPTFYFNIIEGICYSVCQKYEEIPSKLNVYLSVALPPDDLNKKNTDKIRETLKTFRWTHKASGISIDINFNGIVHSTEPEAFIKAFYSMTEEDVPDYTLHIEGGGRSIGAEILVSGESLPSAQRALDYGGSQLLDQVSQLYVTKHGGRPLKRSLLEEAVRTGYVRNGNSVIPVVDIIKEAKKQVAEQISSDLILQVFDQQTRVGLSDLNVISVSGRLFQGTPYEVAGETKEISLADYLQEKMQEISPNTKFVHIKGNFIPAGLVINAILEFFWDQLFGDSSDEVASSETVSEERE